MTRGFVVLAAVVCGAAACDNTPTTLRIGVTLLDGQAAPSELHVSVFDPGGPLAVRRSTATQLPGTLGLRVPDVDQALRVVLESDAPVHALGAIALMAKAHAEVRGDVVLSAATADGDGDGIPDAIDNCPRLANPQQLDADRDGAGNGCDENGDDGGAPGDLSAPGDGGGGGGLPPRLFFTDLTSGPNHGGEQDLGAFITIFGEGFGATRGASRVTIGGHEVARYVVWGENNAFARGLDMIVVQPGSGVTVDPFIAQSIVVTVDGQASNTLPFLVREGNIYFIDHDHPSRCTVSAPASNDCAVPPATNAYTCPAGYGSATMPFGRLYQARCRMLPGDIVYIKKGTSDYTETDPTSGTGSLTITPDFPAGTSDKPIAYVGYPTDNLETGSPVIRQSPTLEWGIVTFLDDRPWYTFAKLVVIGPDKSFPIANSGRRLVSNKITNAGRHPWGAISINNYADSVRLLGNLLKTNGTAGSGHPGIGVFGDSSTQLIDNVEIGWNHIESQQGGASIAVIGTSTSPGNFNDIRIHDNLLVNTSSGDHILVGGSVNSNQVLDAVQIWNNVIVGATGAGVRLNNAMMTVTVAHNTIVSNNAAGITFGTLGAGRVTLVDNIVVAGTGRPYTTGTTSGIFAATNGVGNNLWFNGPSAGCPSFDNSPCHSGDPLFVAPASLDLTVGAGSPAIDQASTSMRYPLDYNGVARGAAPDIGAFERR